MSDEITPTEPKKIQVKVQNTSDTLYSIGLIGAWVYYLGRATTFEERLKGFFKAFAWPAILVLRAFEFFEKE